jgi:hypothetical protein
VAGTADCPEEILYAVRHEKPQPLQLLLAVVDEHVAAVLADEDGHTGAERVILALHHGAAPARNKMEHFLVVGVEVFAHEPARGHRLRAQSERMLHGHHPGRDPD